MTPEEELDRAMEAQALMSHPLFKEAIAAQREALIAGIERSAFADEKLREKLCQQLVALTTFVNAIKTHIETGQLAQETIKRRSKASR